MDRRTFLRRAGLAGATGALGLLAAACGASPAPSRAPRRVSKASATARDSVHEVEGLRVADWLLEENADSRRTTTWIIPRSVRGVQSPPIEGYLDKVSGVQGEELTLYVNTVAPTFRAYVYRIGYYGGYGGRRVAISPELKGIQQAAPHFVRGINMVECDWVASWHTTIGSDWPPGSYLIRLEGAPNQQQYVPFVVRDDASHSTYLVQSSVTTWQAYNPYGGYSLYGGTPIGSLNNFESRSRVVSFNRPYSHDNTALDARGSGDYLGNELPFIYLAERHGLDLSYWTDVDLDSQPHLLTNHRSLISLGHDEYWSMTMRNTVQAAIEKGTNVAFLGANACYRQIRFEGAKDADRRRVICYKDSNEDPITKSNPALATGGSWATDPLPRPESELIGVMYQSYGGNAPFVVADASSWVFAGTGLSNGEHLSALTKNSKATDLVGSEFDGFEPTLARAPGPLQILGHSPTGSESGQAFSDMSYYAVPHKGGVFATGTASWVRYLWDGKGTVPAKLGFGTAPKVVSPLTRITLNVLAAFGAGPAGATRPSEENWRQFYSPTAATIPAKDVP
jgi:hypothetical protein